MVLTVYEALPGELGKRHPYHALRSRSVSLNCVHGPWSLLRLGLERLWVVRKGPASHRRGCRKEQQNGTNRFVEVPTSELNPWRT